MLKSTFFTLSDYRAAAHLAWRQFRSLSPRFLVGLIVAQALVFGGCLSPLLLSDFPKTPWPMLTGVGLGLVAALAFQVGSALAVRKRLTGKGELDFASVWDLLKSWGLLTIRVALVSMAVNFIVGFPSAMIGFADGYNNTTTGEMLLVSVSWWPPFRQVLDSVANSLVGALYLWTFATAVFYPTYKTSIIQRWARLLSWRTWPLAVGFAVIDLVATLWGLSGTAAVAWKAGELVLSQAFVLAQLFVLAEKTKATEFGP